MKSQFVLSVFLSGVSGKFITLGGILLFVCLLYFILPKIMEPKIRDYHKQCELDEDESVLEREEAGEKRDEI